MSNTKLTINNGEVERKVTWADVKHGDFVKVRCSDFEYLAIVCRSNHTDSISITTLCSSPNYWFAIPNSSSLPELIEIVKNVEIKYN